MVDTIKVGGFELEDDHLAVQVKLPNGPLAAFHYCPGKHPALDEAVRVFTSALVDAVTLTMIEAIPAVPDAPDEAMKPCRICDAVTPDNTADERGFVFCAAHRPGS